MADGSAGARARPRGADAIVISSNENPRGPAASALDLLRGRANYRAGRYPDNIGALEDTIAKHTGPRRRTSSLPPDRDRFSRAAVKAYTSGSKALVNGTPSYSSPDRTANQIKAAIKLGASREIVAHARPGRDGGRRRKAPASSSCATPNNPTATVHPVSAIADFIKKVRAPRRRPRFTSTRRISITPPIRAGRPRRSRSSIRTSSSPGRSRRPTAWRGCGSATRSASRRR